MRTALDICGPSTASGRVVTSSGCVATSSGRAWRRTFAAGLAVFALGLTGCGEVESGNDDTYHPASVTSPDPTSTTPPTVKLTEEAARRIDLAFATVKHEDGDLVVDYEALIYDKKGQSWLYEAKGPLTFVRTKVTIDEIDEDEVTLLEGPPPGTKVVARGVTQVYGAELGMEGEH
jgi:hypothetical protein